MTVESATSIDGFNTAFPASGDVKSEGDDHIRLIKSVLKTTFPNLTTPFAWDILTGSLNLRAEDTQATSDNMAIAADVIRYRDANGILYCGTGLSVNNVLTNSGVNGLNTGTKTNDTWYHYYAIRKPDGTQATLASTTFSHTAGPGSLPTGYTQWCYLFSNHYTANALREIKVRGNKVLCNESGGYWTALASGTASTFTAVALAPFVPPNALLVKLVLAMTIQHNTAGVGFTADIRPTGGGTVLNVIGCFTQVANIAMQIRTFVDMTLGTSTQIDYRLNNSASGTYNININIASYIIPNGGS